MGASISTPRYSDTQRREAADWFVVIQAAEAPTGDSLQAWLRWLDEEEGNRAAFEAVAQTWHAMPDDVIEMPSAHEVQADTYDGKQPIDEWLASQAAVGGHETTSVTTSFRRRSSSRRVAWLAVASVVAITVGLFSMNRYQALHGTRADEFLTKAGEQIEITLTDGSHVWLGPKSRLLVGFTKERRGIQLATGEAFFTVKKDRSRPFTVRSSSGDITAVGTAFNVRAVDDHVTVAVSEGVVSVAPTAQLKLPNPATVRVGSGQQLTFTAREQIKALAVIQTPTLGERARWRYGVLIFRDEPLRDVVRDVARYTDRPIEIADSSVGDLHYSGIVYKGAVDEWTAALPESFPVTVIRDDQRQIIKAR
jgi:transmembrane sensor